MICFSVYVIICFKMAKKIFSSMQGTLIDLVSRIQLSRANRNSTWLMGVLHYVDTRSPLKKSLISATLAC